MREPGDAPRAERAGQILVAIIGVLGALLILPILFILPGAAIVVGTGCLVNQACTFATGVPRTAIVSVDTYTGAWAVGSGIFFWVLALLISRWTAEGLLGVVLRLGPAEHPTRLQGVLATGALLVVQVLAALALEHWV